MADNLAGIGIFSAAALDFDGVISRLDIDWKAAIRQASDIAGYNIKSLLIFYDEKFGTLIHKKVSDEMEKLELEALKKAQLLGCTKEAIVKLAQTGIDLFIVSMQTAKVINQFLVQEGLSSYFKEIVTRETCPSKKAQIEYLIKNYRLDPKQIILIDDSKQNVASCSLLGIECFHFKAKTGFLCRQNIDAEEWNKVLASISYRKLAKSTDLGN